MHDLLNAFLQAWNNFCPADYTGFIKEACFHRHHSNAVFNICTASIIATGIAVVGDFFSGSSDWRHSHHHTPHHTTHSGHLSDSATPDTHTPSINYDTVLADSLSPELTGMYQLSDVVNAFGGE